MYLQSEVTRMQRWARFRTCLYGVLLFAVGFFCGSTNAQTPPEESYELILEQCLEHTEIEIPLDGSGNILVLGVVCFWAHATGYEIKITSYIRPHETTSQHKYGAADFHPLYEGNRLEVLMTYHHVIESFTAWLEVIGITAKVGMGNYPYKLIIHIDLRGYKARWAFDENDNQIPYEEGLEILYRLITEAAEQVEPM